MGIDFGKLFADAAKGVTDFIDQAGKDISKAIDQNGDGKLDMSDVQAVLDRSQAALAERQRKADLERLKPFFPEEVKQADFVMPKMIRVDNIDKPHAENPVCKGSIGFNTVLDDISVLTFFHDQADSLGLSFYKGLENGVYYVDPCDEKRYIPLDEYFTYMKMQRVNELVRIAQSLGAKSFKVTYIDKSKSASSGSIDAAAAIKAVGKGASAKVSRSISESSSATSHVEAATEFPGHAPIRPELRYLKNEINILNLIEMRMDPLSPLQHQHIYIEMSNSSGIKMKEAIKIDAALNKMKASGSATVESQAREETHHILEYEIVF